MPDKTTIHWIEVIAAVSVAGLLLVGFAGSIRTELRRERDAMRRAVVASVRAAVEQYALLKGEYPRAEALQMVSGGCVDAEQGIVPALASENCTAVLVGIPPESRSSHELYYQSTPDGRGYALMVQEERAPNNTLCATPFGMERTRSCVPVSRIGKQ